MPRAASPAPIAVVLLAGLVLGGCGRDRSAPPPDLVPSFAGAEIMAQIYFTDATIPDLTLPGATGGDAPLAYSLMPAPPPGLAFDATTRVISGTPTDTLEATEYTYTVRDADGDTRTLTFTMTVATVSMDADKTEVAEWNDPGAEITVRLSEPVSSAVTVTFAVSGTATLGGDYELPGLSAGEAQEDGAGFDVTIEGGASTANAVLQAIPDFDGEGTETIDITAESVAGNTFSDPAPSLSLEVLDEGEMFAGAKDQLTSATLALFNKFRQAGSAYEFHFAVLNLGAARTPATTLRLRINFEDFARGQLLGAPLVSEVLDIPSLPPGSFVEGFFRLPSWVQVRSGPGIYTATALVPAPEGDFFTRSGGFVDEASLLIPTGGKNPFTCEEFARAAAPGSEDPLFPEQWHLNNTGQTAFAGAGGEPGEDLRMTRTLEDGPTGRGVEIAVVDTGLEICHPDLRDNVSFQASYNFNSEAWPRSIATDPFNPSASGDHGTSVAGLIAATANNGIGIRGVAPGAGLRGYNMLSAFNRGVDRTILYDSLGASTGKPASAQVDIFNMSFGLLHGQQGNASPQLVAVIENGVSELREGRGALYVKAAGNNFRLCLALRREHRLANQGRPYSPNDALGCASANADFYNNLPYVIAVGAFNAHGTKSSYSSSGANLWVSAPAGESGTLQPAMVTTDQAGPHRGNDEVGTINELVSDAVDPDGDYISTFGGTSSAAPNTSGAVALMLETEPGLTWRDVKHILARTARMIDPDIEPVRIAFGGKPAVLRHAWITNAAGYNFHNWYGFGAVAVDAALEMTRSYTPGSLGELTTMEFTHAASEGIPDNDGGGVSQTLTVSGIGDTANIEAVELSIRATHTFPSDLGVTLISPAGTESIVNPIYNDALSGDSGGFRDWSLLSNAFYGESPNGDWTLSVMDAAPGDTGSLDAWTLTFSVGEHP